MIKKGRGMASIVHPTGLKGAGDPDYAMIKLKPDGTLDLIIGAVDLGQGAKTILPQFAAEELDVPYENIVCTNRDMDTSGLSMITAASRVTFAAGNATINAAKDLKKKLTSIAAQILELPEEELVVSGGKVHKKDDPGKSADFPAIAATAAHVLGEFPVGIGSFLFSPPAELNPETGAINSHQAIAYGVCIADIEVDTETGVIDIKKLYSVYEIGNVINPLLVEGQIEGGASMGVGMSLTEDLTPYYPEMIHMPTSYTDYVIPTAVDMPEMSNSAFGIKDPDGPYGAKGFSEMTSSAVPPAVVIALYDAIGVWIDTIPLTPEKVLKALEEKG